MHACGHEVVRRELRYVPAQYKVVEHVQTAYSCRNCEKNALATPMKKSEVPAGLIPGSGIVSPSLLAHILNNKVCLWRGADLCCETERVADARVPGRSLGTVQQPCGAGGTALCRGPEELAVFQHAQRSQRQCSRLFYCGDC